MVRSRVGIGGVERPDKVGIFDRQLTIHGQKKRQRLNTEDTGRSTEVTDEKVGSRRLTVQGQRNGQRPPEKNAAEKEKGRNRGLPADSPENYSTKIRFYLQG